MHELAPHVHCAPATRRVSRCSPSLLEYKSKYNTLSPFSFKGASSDEAARSLGADDVELVFRSGMCMRCKCHTLPAGWACAYAASVTLCLLPLTRVGVGCRQQWRKKRRVTAQCSSWLRGIRGPAIMWGRALHVTRHTSHVTHHTSHVTRHTSHVTRHTLPDRRLGYPESHLRQHVCRPASHEVQCRHHHSQPQHPPPSQTPQRKRCYLGRPRSVHIADTLRPPVSGGGYAAARTGCGFVFEILG